MQYNLILHIIKAINKCFILSEKETNFSVEPGAIVKCVTRLNVNDNHLNVSVGCDDGLVFPLAELQTKDKNFSEWLN